MSPRRVMVSIQLNIRDYRTAIQPGAGRNANTGLAFTGGAHRCTGGFCTVHAKRGTRNAIRYRHWIGQTVTATITTRLQDTV